MPASPPRLLARSRRLLRTRALAVRSAVVALAALLCGAANCAGSNVGENEVLGREGLVRFGAETKLAFTTRLVAGSTFAVSFAAVDEEETSVAGARLVSSDPEVLEVEEGAANVRLLQPGVAELRLEKDGAVLDAVELRAGKPSVTTLVDGALLRATDTVDPRLPSTFAVRTDTEHELLIAAVDVCGGELIDLHASTIEAGGEAGAVPVAIEEAGPANFTVKTEVPGEVTLVLKTPLLDDLPYNVTSVDPGQVDEVNVAPTAADEAGNVSLWGRAFVDDTELVGPLAFSWTGDPRVTLNALQGTIVTATVSFPEPGEPEDVRPAVVSAEVFGERGAVDLLSNNLNAATSRGPPPRFFEEPEPTGGCTGEAAEACNPEAALALLLGGRALRRVRRLARAARAAPAIGVAREGRG